MSNNIYTKPQMKYWSADELDCIEAKMSGGGGGVIQPMIIIKAATYNGTNITVNFEVTRNNDGSWQIGYEYAFAAHSVLLGYTNSQFGRYVPSSKGTYTMNIPATNFNCEIRLCTRLMQTDNLATLDAKTNWILSYLPSEHRVETFTIDKTTFWIWKLYNDGLGMVLDLEGGTVAKIIGYVRDIGAGIKDIAIDLGIINIPKIAAGQFYRVETYYLEGNMYMKLEMWENQSNYIGGRTPAFSYIYKNRIPHF